MMSRYIMKPGVLCANSPEEVVLADLGWNLLREVLRIKPEIDAGAAFSTTHDP